MDKTKLLDGIPQLDEEDRRRFANALDRAEKARDGHGLTYAGFFDPRQIALLTPVLTRCGFVFRAEAGVGGEAERAVLLFLPDYYAELDTETLRTLDEYPLSAIEIQVSGLHQTGKNLTHRDYLGTLMGLGIRRETIGDLYPTESGCTFACLREIAPHITASLDKVSSLRAEASVCGFDRLIPPQPKFKEIKTTLASLRLDSAVAESFSVSRSEAQESIKKGLVTLNWLECREVSRPVAEGDKLSFKGKGRARIIESGKLTKKGNLFTIIHRYI